MTADAVDRMLSKPIRRAWDEARRNKVRMVCSVCDRDVEVFTYNPALRAWIPRPRKDPPRPTGLVYPSESELGQALVGAGHLFRCHRRCGRVEAVPADRIALCCFTAVGTGALSFKF